MSTKLGTLTLDLVARIGSFTQGMRDASASVEREMGRAGNSVNTMDGLLKKLAVTVGTVFSVSQIANYADSYTGMVNKMKLVTDGQNQLSTAMGDTHKIAQATASDWSSVVDVYTKFQKISDRLGLSQSEVARITETVTKAVGISGASADEAQRSLVQFSQALSLGVLRGQDLNSVMQQTPGLTDAIAKGMGVTSDKLKQMGSDGILTTQKVVEALQKVAGSIDADYAETATLIASSFSLVKNEAIKMIGEFDQAHGVSQTFVQGMTAVADNIENISKVMLVAGAYMAGTYIPVIIKGTYATVSDTASKVANIVALRAKAIADYDVAKSNLASTAAMVRAMGATNAQTAAMMANARAAYQQATAAKAAALSGTSLSSALLGPVGVGIALASVAASFLLMSDNAKESTISLLENNVAVGDAVKAYQELNAVQQAGQLVAEKEKLEELENVYRQASTALDVYASGMATANEFVTESQVELSKLLAEYGETKNLELFNTTVQKSLKVSQSAKDQVALLASKVDMAGNAAKNQREFYDKLSNSISNTADQAKKSAVEVANLSEELKKLLSSNAEAVGKNTYMSIMTKKGVDPKLAEMMHEARKAEGLLGTGKTLSIETQKSVFDRWKSEQSLNKTLEDRAKLEEKSKKLIEAQGSAMKVNSLVAANAAKYNFVSIEAKNKLPAGLLSAIHMQESKGNANAYNKSSGATGGFQFLKGTADQYGVKNRNDLAQSAEGAGKYMAYLLKLFKGDLDKAISAYHAGEGNVQRGTNIGPINRQYVKNIKGYMGGASGVSFSEDYSFNDYIKDQERIVELQQEQAQKQKEIQLGVADETARIRADLADKLKEIDEAAFGEAESSRLKAQYTERAENEIKIAESTHADKLADYSAYTKTEEQLINDSYDRRQRDLKLDLSLTHDEYTQASLNLETLRKRELEATRRDQKLELLEVKRDWMDKIQYAQEYYALVREEILSNDTYSPEMKDAKIKQANIQQGIAENEKRESVWDDYKGRFDVENSPYQSDIDLLKEAREQMLITEEEYQQRRLQMQGLYGGRYAADFAGMMMGLVDSSSSAYSILGSAQKAFTLFSVGLSSIDAIGKAWASAPFPYNLGAVASATMETGLLQAAVSAMSPVGMAHNGIDNIPKEGTWLLDGGERVLNPKQNQDLTRYLEGARQGSVASNTNVSVIMVKDEDEAKNYKYSKDFEDAVIYHMKRNRSKV